MCNYSIKLLKIENAVEVRMEMSTKKVLRDRVDKLFSPAQFFAWKIFKRDFIACIHIECLTERSWEAWDVLYTCIYGVFSDFFVHQNVRLFGTVANRFWSFIPEHYPNIVFGQICYLDWICRTLPEQVRAMFGQCRGS